MEKITVWPAFLAGLASFFSPCVLPLLPLYIALLAPEKDGRRVLWPAVSFIAGFSLVFIILGLTASAIGGLLLEYQTLLRKVGAVFMVALGAFQTGLIAPSFLLQDKRPFLIGAQNSSRFLLGMAFVFGWAPCSSPLLGGILLYAGLSENMYYGGWLLAAYSAGFALPLFAAALTADSFIIRIKTLALPWLNAVQKFSGIVLIITGLLLYFNKLPQIIGFFT